LLFFLVLIPVYGQSQVEMADHLRAEGKIYVVVAIVLIVLAGLIFYLFLMDKKVNKLAKMLSDKKKQTN
jgi:cobalamin synthase